MRHFSCRDQFSLKDIEFVSDSLKKQDSDKEKITELFFDEKCRDKMLDSNQLFSAVVNDEEKTLTISMRMFFYVTVRNLLKDYGIDNRDVSDYVSELLVGHSHDNIESTYLFDMVQEESNTSNEGNLFNLITRKADTLLILTGLFPKMIEKRNRVHGAPNIKFYEDQGANAYGTLSNSRYAEKENLRKMFETIGSDFHRMRSSMNCLMIAK